MAPERKIVALVPAGDRGAGDPVAKVSGVTSKVLAPLAGTPLVIRVLNALQATGRVDSIVLSGPDPAAIEGCPQLRDVISRDDITWIPAGNALGDSVQAGLAEIDPAALVLITTADHGLLDTSILDYFLDRAMNSRADVNVGLVDYDLIKTAYPGGRRTVLKFSGAGIAVVIYTHSPVRAPGRLSYCGRVSRHIENNPGAWPSGYWVSGRWQGMPAAA